MVPPKFLCASPKEMAANVKPGKSGSWDGFSDYLFALCRPNCPCNRCANKEKLWRTLLDPIYWEHPLAKQHLRSRLVCLNKVHPATPKVPEYRPIVIASPVVKFLEGYIVPDLRRYAT